MAKDQGNSSYSEAQLWYAEVGSWACQMIASLSWVISVFIYYSVAWEIGDAFQFVAASAWSVSNLLGLPRKQTEKEEGQEGTQRCAEVGAWTCQMIASLSWIICVCIYDSWESGDAFQMLAACAWTVSNLLTIPCKQEQPQPQPQQQQQKQQVEITAMPAGLADTTLAAGDEEGGRESDAGPERDVSDSKGAQRSTEVGAWGGQMCASMAWMISVIIYDSWGSGDAFQMLAATAWTVSNLLALPGLSATT